MSIGSVTGHTRTKSMLLGMLLRERIASSYLFCGEAGIGKRTTALNFAKAVNCINNTHSGDACDACSSCVKIDAGSHPDLTVISPEERVIKIEEIRAVEEALSYRPYEGKKKIVIVDDAETMNMPAANAFLKTLEEPPGESLIILVSAKPDAMPATIRSRCCRINFYPLSNEDCRTVLGRQDNGPDLELNVALAMGRPGSAEAADLKEERDWFLGHFRNMLEAGKDGWASREDMDRWFDQALIMLRDLAVLKTEPAHTLVNEDLRGYLSELGKAAGLKVIISLYSELNLLRGQLLYNLNKSITWNYTASILRKELNS